MTMDDMRDDSMTDERWERIRGRFPVQNFPEGRPGRNPIQMPKVLEPVL